jgi:hypothetical protein
MFRRRMRKRKARKRNENKNIEGHEEFYRRAAIENLPWSGRVD